MLSYSLYVSGRQGGCFWPILSDSKEGGVLMKPVHLPSGQSPARAN